MDEAARMEGPQAQRLCVQPVPRFRIAVEENLKAPVQEKSVHTVRPHPSADRIRSLQHLDVDPTFLQAQTADQAGQSAANHNDFGHSLNEYGFSGLG